MHSLFPHLYPQGHCSLPQLLNIVPCHFCSNLPDGEHFPYQLRSRITEDRISKGAKWTITYLLCCSQGAYLPSVREVPCGLHLTIKTHKEDRLKKYLDNKWYSLTFSFLDGKVTL